MTTFSKFSLITLCCFSSSLYAQSTPDEQSQWNVKLGAGVMAKSQAWKGINTQVATIPYVEVNIGHWYFDVENPITYKLEVNSFSALYAGIGLRSDHYEAADVELNPKQEANIFKGYQAPHTETLINYGASLGLLSLDASHDISNNSKSNTLALTVEVPVFEGATGFNIATLLSADWMDANYVNYYYGVSGSQTDNSVGRGHYHTSSAINYELAIQAMYPVTDQWILLGKLSHALLANEITESPLIDLHHQDFLGLLAVYQF